MDTRYHIHPTNLDLQDELLKSQFDETQYYYGLVFESQGDPFSQSELERKKYNFIEYKEMITAALYNLKSIGEAKVKYNFYKLANVFTAKMKEQVFALPRCRLKKDMTTLVPGKKSILSQACDRDRCVAALLTLEQEGILKFYKSHKELSIMPANKLSKTAREYINNLEASYEFLDNEKLYNMVEDLREDINTCLSNPNIMDVLDEPESFSGLTYTPHKNLSNDPTSNKWLEFALPDQETY